MIYNKILQRQYNNWKELEQIIAGLSNDNEKGAVMEEFAYLYLKIKKNLYNIKSVYKREDVPQEFIDLYKLENIDYGVDGIYITNQDQVIGYQVKFRSNRDNTPSYRELSTFWTESEHLDGRLIIANTNSLPRPTQNRKNSSSLLANDLDNLDENFFIQLANATNNTQEELIKITPYDYQIKIINDVVKGFEEADRGKLIAACG